jgi:hypothetical protein
VVVRGGAIVQLRISTPPWPRSVVLGRQAATSRDLKRNAQQVVHEMWANNRSVSRCRFSDIKRNELISLSEYRSAYAQLATFSYLNNLGLAQPASLSCTMKHSDPTLTTPVQCLGKSNPPSPKPLPHWAGPIHVADQSTVRKLAESVDTRPFCPFDMTG